MGDVEERYDPRPVASRPRHGDKTHFLASEGVKAAAYAMQGHMKISERLQQPLGWRLTLVVGR